MNRVEAEDMLAELQRGRPKSMLRGRTQLEDLDQRLEESVMWCRRYSDFNAVATCLRPSRVSPPPLSPNRWAAAESVVVARRAEFKNLPDVTLDDIAGRLLVYFPDGSLGDRVGAVEGASRNFFDIHHAPPFGTWLGYFEDNSATDPQTTAYLIAWIPRVFVNDASEGIKFNPAGRLAWLKDTKIAMRHIKPHLRLSPLMMD